MKRLVVLPILFLMAFALYISPSTLADNRLSSHNMAAPNVTYTFTVINKTGYDIKGLFMAPTSSADWDEDEDLLSGKLFANGASLKVTYNATKNASKWDMMCVWTDGSANSVWNGIDLNGTTKITLTYDKSSDTTYINKE